MTRVEQFESWEKCRRLVGELNSPKYTPLATSINDTMASRFNTSVNIQKISGPSPEMSLVIYNVPKNVNLIHAVHHLATRSNVYKREIVDIRYLGSSRENAPIIVTCSDKYTRWAFLKSVNSDRYCSSYARPYLSPKDLQKDRELVSLLQTLRHKYPSKSFVIRRGVIVEVIEDHYVAFNVKSDATTADNTSPKRSSNGVPNSLSLGDHGL
jgi:hypothetical protein